MGVVIPGLQFAEKSMNPPGPGGTKYLVIHAMSEYLFNEGRVWPAAEFLKSQGLSVHYTVLPDGTPVKHLDAKWMGAHAKGHNLHTVGVELLLSGLHSYETFLTDIKWPAAYSDRQYEGLLTIMKSLVSGGHISDPLSDWTTHHKLDPTRKFDPGMGFSQSHWYFLLDNAFGHER